VRRLSHSQLELRIDRLVLAAGGHHVDDGDDVFVFVVSGSCRIEIAGVAYELDHRDAIDVERAGRLDIGSTDGVTALLVRAGRR
jgi:hypothetical protein